MAEEKKATGLKLFNQTITSVATQKYLADVLGERKASFVNNLTALVANNSMLQECEQGITSKLFPAGEML